MELNALVCTLLISCNWSCYWCLIAAINCEKNPCGKNGKCQENVNGKPISCECNAGYIGIPPLCLGMLLITFNIAFSLIMSKMLMNACWELPTVVLMALVSILRVDTFVNVPEDTIATDLFVWVSTLSTTLHENILNKFKLDDNECALGTDTCNENAVCFNTIGSYSCVCKLGYTGDGHSCSGTLSNHEMLVKSINHCCRPWWVQRVQLWNECTMYQFNWVI